MTTEQAAEIIKCLRAIDVALLFLPFQFLSLL